MKLERLILDNFLSFQNFDYEFQNRPLLVQGLNLTEETQKSNGSGKSSMATGIEFCITASNSRDVRDVELVKYGESEARAQLYASCDIRKEYLHIDWTIKVKGSNQLSLFKKPYNGDWEEISFSNVNDGKKAILSWFAISKEDLFNYYIINKTRFKSFFKSSNKEKVDLINRFSDASIIEGVEEIDNSELESEYQQAEFEVARAIGKLEAIDEELILEKNRDLNKDFNLHKAQYEEQIKDYEETIADYKLDLEDDLKTKKSVETELKNAKHLESKISIIQEQAEKLVDTIKIVDHSEDKNKLLQEIQELEDEHDEIDEERDALIAKRVKVETLIHKLNIKLGGAIECPSCAHEFVLDDDLAGLIKKKDEAVSMIGKIDDLLNEKSKLFDNVGLALGKCHEEVNKLIELESESKIKYQEKLDAVDDIKKQRRDAQNKVDIFQRQLRDIEEDVSDAESEIKDTERLLKSKQSELKNLKPKDNGGRLEELRVSRDEQLERKLECEVNKNTIGDKIYERNQWKTNFKQFRSFVANQSLEVIEYHMNRYLNDMNSDLRVKMEGFKILANGSIKDNITAKIIRDEERTFSSFSGGERGRLLFASILANRHMINSSNIYGGLDYLNIDEIFEGVDSLGLKHLLESAKSLEISAHIITHVSDEDVSGDVLTIVKENGISKIKE